MKNIFKSYLKSYLRKWFQYLGLIIFLLTIFTVFIGMIATPFQFKNQYNYISNHTNKWQYNMNANSGDTSIQYDYYFFEHNGMFSTDDKIIW